MGKIVTWRAGMTLQDLDEAKDARIVESEEPHVDVDGC